jgi:RNA polymerase sigma-70 factor (ECF subfamily)
MTGSVFEAEDAVQETMLRAWRSYGRFEGRSALRSWLYRIATNVCFDMLAARGKRARPIDMGPAGTVESELSMLPEVTWIEPIPDSRVMPLDGDPAEIAMARETIRLAFIAALQHLPPRQRSVLILREVLGWRAAEVAELLETTVQSVNSALQRARATLAATQTEADSGAVSAADLGAQERELLERYVAAFERYEMDSLVALLHEDAVQSMPPYDLWLRGRSHIRAWWAGPGAPCKGSRLVAAPDANGLPAFGQYRPSGPGGAHEPWALQVLELDRDGIRTFTAFLDVERLFPVFGLPPSPPARA